MSKKDESVEVSRRRRPGRSLFGPVVLIAIGLYFLLANANVLPALNWAAALRVWPLLLIFLGLNVIVRQARRPLGTLLSGLVAVAAIITFAFFLLGGQMGRLGGSVPSDELQREIVRFPAEGVTEGRVDLDFSSFPSRVGPLEAGDDLIEADVAYVGELVFRGEVTDDRVEIILGTEANFSPFWWFNPTNWASSDDEWEIGLSPDIPLALQLDVGSGSADFELDGLDLIGLDVDGGSGSVALHLPDGNYDARYDIGSGSLRMWLPDEGQQTVEIEGGSGSLTIFLAENTEARVVVEDDGSGAFRPADRLVQVEDGDGDEGAWETAGFQDGGDGVTIVLDIASGSVRVREDS